MADALVPARAVIRALRPHHWVKNLLVFVPILAAHRWDEPVLWAEAGLAAVAFSLCSSAVYLANDLLDVEDDRAHPVKRHRPLASGKMRPDRALMLAAILAASGLAMAAAVGAAWVLLLYVLASLAYSAWAKTLPGVDLVALVGLYTLRLLAGGEATGIAVSGWLLAYGACIFASLALAKRSAELGAVAVGQLPLPRRRGYRVQDRGLLTALGLAAAAGSGVVLAVYLQGAQARSLYDRPGWLILAGAVVILWLFRVWRLDAQGRLQTDPVVFALKDPVSLGAGFGVLALLVMAAG
ncbi:MAG: UbiA family prenyltransferase [Rhodobacterales bacterium]|nr:UbiA family prenyltransferase [Rhodobacterales bacterium]